MALNALGGTPVRPAALAFFSKGDHANHTIFHIENQFFCLFQILLTMALDRNN
jgi:hypothetical protein